MPLMASFACVLIIMKPMTLLRALFELDSLSKPGCAGDHRV